MLFRSVGNTHSKHIDISMFSSTTDELDQLRARVYSDDTDF